jgi:hypothetical protein
VTLVRAEGLASSALQPTDVRGPVADLPTEVETKDRQPTNPSRHVWTLSEDGPHEQRDTTRHSPKVFTNSGKVGSVG